MARLESAETSDKVTRFRRIRGQVEGLERMVEEGRYCLDIVHQIRSVIAALKSAETLVLEQHVRHCVRDAIRARDQKLTEEKINELLVLFQKR